MLTLDLHADQIEGFFRVPVDALKHPPLASTLRHNSSLELRKLTWTGAARRCLRVYGEVSCA